MVQHRPLRAATGCLILIAAMCGPLAWAQNGTAAPELLEEQAFKQAVALVSPSVVRIETVGGLDRIGDLLASTGPTTGVVVSADGYIVTSSFNFVAKPSSILVTLPDGRRLAARLVASDHLKMLTLLKVDATNLLPARPAPTDSIRVGQWSIAVGKTYDRDVPSLSVGIVSALNRVWGKAIQTDAKVSPVNYGGPLVDIHGQVLGLLVPLSATESTEAAGVEWYDSGIGFAIPMDATYAAVNRMKEGTDLSKGLMGIVLAPGDDYGDMPAINQVRPNSPAEQAGLKSGDQIISIDGQKVERRAQMQHVLGNRYALDTVHVIVKRGDDEIDADVTLVAELMPYESPFLGILPERFAASDDDLPGVRVRMTYPAGPAEKAGLQSQDRITKLDDTDVTDAASLLAVVSHAQPEDRVIVGYVREGQEAQVEIALGSIPDTVPETIRSAAIPPVNKDDDAAAEHDPRMGRFTDRMPDYEHDYWAYVPDTYNPQFTYGLMVWIHPAGDAMEAVLYEKWKSVCQRRGIILVAPKAEDSRGWTVGEAPFVTALVQEFQQRYSIDPSRIFVHSFGDGGSFAYHLVFKERSLFRGVCTLAAPLTVRILENEPDYRLQWFLACGSQDSQLKAVRTTVEALKKLKYPVSFREFDGGEGHDSPPDDVVQEMGRWADVLDRI